MVGYEDFNLCQVWLNPAELATRPKSFATRGWSANRSIKCSPALRPRGARSQYRPRLSGLFEGRAAVLAGTCPAAPKAAGAVPGA